MYMFQEYAIMPYVIIYKDVTKFMLCVIYYNISVCCSAIRYNLFKYIK